MGEHYAAVDGSLQWMFAPMWLLGAVYLYYQRKRRSGPALPLLYGWPSLGAIALAYALEWPSFCLLVLVAAGLLNNLRNKAAPPRDRWFVPGVFLAMLAGCAYSARLFSARERFVLGADTLEFAVRSSDGPVMKSLPKSRVRIRAVQYLESWKSWHDTSEWTISDVGGPVLANVDGTHFYWGPRGLIRGADVGRRIVRWAGG